MKKSENTDDQNVTHYDSRYSQVCRRLFLAGVVTFTAGCQNIVRRGQSPDELPSVLSQYDKQGVTQGPRSVGDICGLYGLDAQKVFGIGLAKGLKGTGSAPIESGQREHLLRELKLTTRGEDVGQLVLSGDTELVILQGSIPPGAAKGERFDLQVVTMSDTKGTSIEHGTVLQCRMRKMAHLNNRVKRGNIAAVGRGKILVKSLFSDTTEDQGLLEGVILNGGETTEARQMSLRIRGEDFDQKTALRIAFALNERFEYRSTLGHDGVAEPKTDRIIEIKIPDVYRHNIGRYASVLNQLVFAETPAQREKRLHELEAAFSSPAQSGLVALQLEAIGDLAWPVLRRGLEHHDQEVRFHAAEALAYMGQLDGVEELVAAIKADPGFRWHGFAALTSLNDRDVANQLSGLFNEGEPEIRYGAFRALRNQNPDDPVVQGELMDDDFYLCEVDSSAPPLIHFSSRQRSEITVFGDSPTISDEFLYVESGLTIRGNRKGLIALTAYSPEFNKEQRVSTDRVVDLIRTLSDMGYGYSQQYKILRQAQEDEMLDGELAVDATPKLANARQSRPPVQTAATDKKKSDKPGVFDWLKPNN